MKGLAIGVPEMLGTLEKARPWKDSIRSLLKAEAFHSGKWRYERSRRWVVETWAFGMGLVPELELTLDHESMLKPNDNLFDELYPDHIIALTRNLATVGALGGLIGVMMACYFNKGNQDSLGTAWRQIREAGFWEALVLIARGVPGLALAAMLGGALGAVNNSWGIRHTSWGIRHAF